MLVISKKYYKILKQSKFPNEQKRGQNKALEYHLVSKSLKLSLVYLCESQQHSEKGDLLELMRGSLQAKLGRFSSSDIQYFQIIPALSPTSSDGTPKIKSS